MNINNINEINENEKVTVDFENIKIVFDDDFFVPNNEENIDEK
ncbi:hypothetical protein [Campylobacter canadensis]|nr:hypothetical protein [Campylobacter canadensis]